MMIRKMAQDMDWFWYQENSKGELTLLRMFGASPEVTVPAYILGKPVVALADYCFSLKSKVASSECKIQSADATLGDKSETGAKDTFLKLLEEQKIRELSGNYLTEIFLPDTMKKIGDLCFYQCKELRKINLGVGDIELGSDAFMNCSQLHQFIIRGSSNSVTGLRQILAQRSGEIEVFFKNREIEAALLFPEYVERYDLIGPAHIFELNIEGEGLRARQCFENGIFQFQKYDLIFLQAKKAEEETTLCKMAMFRLQYPIELKAETRKQYEKYLISHLDVFCDALIKEKDLETLSLIRSIEDAGQTRIPIDFWKKCMKKTVAAGWPEGTRTILAWRKDFSGEEEDTEYGFEDF